MVLLQVGQRYHPKRHSWPEGVEFNYRGSSHELLIRANDPTAKEQHALRKGAIQFGLVIEQPVIVFLATIPGFGTFEAPYTWHLVPEADRWRTAPLKDEPNSNRRALIHVILIRANTGIITAMRQVTVSPTFTRVLHNAIAAQVAIPFDASAYDRHLHTLFSRYTSEELAARAVIMEQGGLDNTPDHSTEVEE